MCAPDSTDRCGFEPAAVDMSGDQEWASNFMNEITCFDCPSALDEPEPLNLNPQGLLYLVFSPQGRCLERLYGMFIKPFSPGFRC